MRFTVVATGRFRPRRAFWFGLAGSSLTLLSVVNSPIRPAGLSPAWPPASPAHTEYRVILGVEAQSEWPGILGTEYCAQVSGQLGIIPKACAVEPFLIEVSTGS